MKTLAAIVTILVPLAGCIGSVDQDAEDDSSRSATHAEPLYDFVAIATVEYSRGEPSLGVTPDGILFMTAASEPDDPVGVTRDLLVLRSMDDGRTWGSLGTPLAPTPDGDPDLAVDRDGTVWIDILYSNACAHVGVSRDLGQTWHTDPLACGIPSGDRPWIVPTEGGTAYLFWYQVPSFVTFAIKTSDYGQTWSTPVPVQDVVTSTEESGGWSGGGCWSPVTGSVFIAFPVGHGLFLDPAFYFLPGYSVSRDGGQTWEIDTVTDQPWGQRLGLGNHVCAVDDVGNVYLAWQEKQGDDAALFVAGSADDGRSWSAPLRLNTPSNTSVFPAITAGGTGGVAVAFYEASEGTLVVSGAATWNVTMAWTADFFSAGTWHRGLLNDEPVRRGSFFYGNMDGSGDLRFLDFFSIERLPDGRVGAAFNSMEHADGHLATLYSVTKDPLLAPWPG